MQRTGLLPPGAGPCQALSPLGTAPHYRAVQRRAQARRRAQGRQGVLSPAEDACGRGSPATAFRAQGGEVYQYGWMRPSQVWKQPVVSSDSTSNSLISPATDSATVISPSSPPMSVRTQPGW